MIQTQTDPAIQSQPALQRAIQTHPNPAIQSQPAHQPTFQTLPAIQHAFQAQSAPQQTIQTKPALPAVQLHSNPQLAFQPQTTPQPQTDIPQQSFGHGDSFDDLESLLSASTGYQLQSAVDTPGTSIEPLPSGSLGTQSFNDISPYQPANQCSMAGLVSPERVMVRFPGRDESSLRRLAVELARQCIFGEQTLSVSTISGRNNTYQLDPDKLNQIKTIVKARSGVGTLEFEGIWCKCIESIKKKCQALKKKQLHFHNF